MITLKQKIKNLRWTSAVLENGIDKLTVYTSVCKALRDNKHRSWSLSTNINIQIKSKREHINSIHAPINSIHVNEGEIMLWNIQGGYGYTYYLNIDPNVKSKLVNGKPTAPYEQKWYITKEELDKLLDLI